MKPGDFLIGAKDFFAILVPGAAFLLVLSPSVPGFAGVDPKLLSLFAAGVAAYLIGSIATGVGFGLDVLMDRVLETELYRQKDTGFENRRGRGVTMRAEAAKHCQVAGLSDDIESLQVFWKDYLRLYCPAGVAEVDRVEATHKLFRSLAIVSFALLVWHTIYEPLPRFSGSSAEAWLGMMLGVSLALYLYRRRVTLCTTFRLGCACVLAHEPERVRQG